MCVRVPFIRSTQSLAHTASSLSHNKNQHLHPIHAKAFCLYRNYPSLSLSFKTRYDRFVVVHHTLDILTYMSRVYPFLWNTHYTAHLKLFLMCSFWCTLREPSRLLASCQLTIHLVVFSQAYKWVIIIPVVVRNVLQKTDKPKLFDHKRNHNIMEELKTTTFEKNQ